MSDESRLNSGRFGLIIYDGTCGVCTSFVGKRAHFFEKHGFAVAPLQTPGIPEYAHRDIAELMTAIHVVTVDGYVVSGIDAFGVVAARVWWLWPVSMAMRVPVLKRVFGMIYAAVAKRRQGISRVCGFRPPHNRV
jgi:predicted DCC family thiol-disulfide oxidoreductase YuxK